MAVVALCNLAPASAQNMQLFGDTKDKVMIDGHEVSRFNSCPSNSMAQDQARPGAKKSQKKAATHQLKEQLLIIDEDFSNLTAGSEEVPDTTPLASKFGEPGWNIDSKWMHTAGWTGSWVYQAGGKCALIDTYGWVGACLNTPLGDYSGDLTITFKIKALGDAQSNNIVFVNAMKGGTNHPKWASDGQGGDLSETIRIYPGMGWMNVEINFHNVSADADGFIQLNCYGQVLIDDLRIVSDINFLASPKLNDATNFKDTEFTINWDPVRAAQNYWLHLYKKEVTGDMGLTLTADFEDGVLPDDWTLKSENEPAFSDNQGANGSRAIILHNADTLITPDRSAIYQKLSYYMKAVVPDGTEATTALGNALITVLVKDQNTWRKLGTFNPRYFTNGINGNLDTQAGGKFAGKYQAVAFTISGFSDDCYLILDNFEIETDIPIVMTEVYDDSKSIPGYYYDEAYGTSYTFTDLDPYGEYYYSVRAHYYTMQSDEAAPTYAFGVAAPELLPATDINADGSYTANWETAPKATRYLATNYGVTTVEKNGRVAILDEDFSKVDASVTDSTDPFSPSELGNTNNSASLDDYTKLPGWTGTNVAFAQGYLGGGSMDFYTPSVMTPSLYLANATTTILTIKAVGYQESSLIIDDGTTKYQIYYEPNSDGETGSIDGTYTINTTGKNVKLDIYDNSGYPFMLDYLKLEQDVKAGDRFYTWLESYETTAAETSHRFTSSDQHSYKMYGYSLMSYFDKDGDTAESDINGYMLVNPAEGSTMLGLNADAIEAEATVVARYTVDGTRLNAPQKGINILKLSNGRTVKQIVK